MLAEVLSDIRDADPDLLVANGYADHDLTDLADALPGDTPRQLDENCPNRTTPTRTYARRCGASSSPAPRKTDRPDYSNAWLERTDGEGSRRLREGIVIRAEISRGLTGQSAGNSNSFKWTPPVKAHHSPGVKISTAASGFLLSRTATRWPMKATSTH
jgi:hypothetical protein